MMMTVQEFYRFFEDKFPRMLSAEWDNDGLACAPDPSREVKRVLVALDATSDVVARAVEGGFDLLLTHHPLLFRGIKALVPVGAVPTKLLKLALGGVAAMSFHTRLDAVTGGVNDILAERLGLSDVTPFAPEGEVPCGRIGKLQAPISVADFSDTVCRVLGIPALLAAGEGNVNTVAVLGGEGGDFVDAARRAGADLFLAGRIGYHRMLDAAETGLCLMEAGHNATERPVCEVLAKLLRACDPTLEIEISQGCPIGVHLYGKD
jgi:dinuclear metal center YbgI/SA1388 family protein